MLWATQNNDFFLYTTQGKKIWKDILGEYNKNGPWGTFAILEEKLYESTTSQLRQDFLTLFTDLLTAAALTFGILPSALVVDYIRGRAYKKHYKKFLRQI